MTKQKLLSPRIEKILAICGVVLITALVICMSGVIGYLLIPIWLGLPWYTWPFYWWGLWWLVKQPLNQPTKAKPLPKRPAPAIKIPDIRGLVELPEGFEIISLGDLEEKLTKKK